MHCVMLRSVTTIYQKAYPQQEGCITSVYLQSKPLLLGKDQKGNGSVNSNEMWSDRTLWNILYEMPASH